MRLCVQVRMALFCFATWLVEVYTSTIAVGDDDDGDDDVVVMLRDSMTLVLMMIMMAARFQRSRVQNAPESKLINFFMVFTQQTHARIT